MKSVERMKTKLIRWRAFTRTTLDTTQVTAESVNQAEADRLKLEKKTSEKKRKSTIKLKSVKFEQDTEDKKDEHSDSDTEQ